MKKLIAGILAVLYIGTSTGIPLHIHYCMGDVAGWGFSYHPSDKCGRCGMETHEGMDNGCCKDEFMFLKNDLDQKITESIIPISQVLSGSLPADFPNLQTAFLFFETPNHQIGQPPPRAGDIAVFIRNCVFLI